jgi:hypothetical protein
VYRKYFWSRDRIRRPVVDENCEPAEAVQTDGRRASVELYRSYESKDVSWLSRRELVCFSKLFIEGIGLCSIILWISGDEDENSRWKSFAKKSGS